ncbi:MAG: hypothetical protein AB7I41_17535 [Candidatus Sericytochromatia bacterium]
MKKVILGFVFAGLLAGCQSAPPLMQTMQPQLNTHSAALNRQSATPTVNNANQTLLKAYFEFLDTNQNDRISQTEFKKQFHIMTPVHFPKFDLNRDQQITRQEFYAHMPQFEPRLSEEGFRSKIRNINWPEMISNAPDKLRYKSDFDYLANMETYLRYVVHPAIPNPANPVTQKETARFKRYDRNNDLNLNLDEFTDLMASRAVEHQQF